MTPLCEASKLQSRDADESVMNKLLTDLRRETGLVELSKTLLQKVMEYESLLNVLTGAKESPRHYISRYRKLLDKEGK